MMADPETEHFFARLIQRVSPKSYAQAKGEVVVTRKFLENYSGDQVRSLGLPAITHGSSSHCEKPRLFAATAQALSNLASQSLHTSKAQHWAKSTAWLKLTMSGMSRCDSWRARLECPAITRDRCLRATAGPMAQVCALSLPTIHP